MQYENDANATVGAGTGTDRETGPGASGIGTAGSAAGDSGAGGGGRGGGEPAQSRGDEMKARTRERADDLAHRAAERIEGTVERQKGRAGTQLSDLARSLRVARDQLPTDDGISRYMGLAATQVDNLASFLDDHDVSELVEDVEDFARRQPALFIGGAFAAGLLGARFLKSTRRDRSTRGRMWDEDDPTYRVRDAARDAVSRPDSPGYAPPAARSDGRVGDPDRL